MEIFLKGLTHDFGQKLKFFSLLAFKQIGLKIMFADNSVRNKPTYTEK